MDEKTKIYEVPSLLMKLVRIESDEPIKTVGVLVDGDAADHVEAFSDTECHLNIGEYTAALNIGKSFYNQTNLDFTTNSICIALFNNYYENTLFNIECEYAGRMPIIEPSLSRLPSPSLFKSPSQSPTKQPSKSFTPSQSPSESPSQSPTKLPSQSFSPSQSPTKLPSQSPTEQPTNQQTHSTTSMPTQPPIETDGNDDIYEIITVVNLIW